MTRKNAEEKINNIFCNINKENAEKALSELDEIYAIKPVSTMWYVAKAKALAALGKIKESYEILNGKYVALDVRDSMLALCEQYRNNAVISNDENNIIRMGFIEELAKAYSGSTCSLTTVKKLIEKIELTNHAFVKNVFDEKLICEEQILAYQSQNVVLANIVEAYCVRNNISYNLEKWVKNSTNAGYIREYLTSGQCRDVIVMESEDEVSGTGKVIASICAELGHKVYYVRKPLNLKENKTIEEMLSKSIDTMKNYGNCVEITSYENNLAGDDRDYILQYLFTHLFDGRHALCFGSGNLIDTLIAQPLLQKNMQRISDFFAPYLNFITGCAWIGSYTSYISDIYLFDADKKINSKPKCRFSIVIPARNSIYTLKHTIKTCLDQTFRGEYEIIISDNSTDGNPQIYDFFKELDDSRIKYFKTPRNLHLPKSFEFAYLQAEGEYVLAIGSDDGLLPWALEIIDQVATENPDEQIIQWDRGFYAWSGFNGGQQNQFIIPAQYHDKYKTFYKTKEEYLAEVLADTSKMYKLPLLYINSCYKKEYLKTIIDKTGRLWDGTCQDIYIGLVNVSINDRILNIDYPLSIAGMSESSIGTQANRPTRTLEQLAHDQNDIVLDGNVGGYCLTPMEYLIPATGTDTWSFYTSFLRLVSTGVLPAEYIDVLLDWKKIFLNMLVELDVSDVLYDRRMGEMNYAAYLHGDDFYCWFKNNLLKVAYNRNVPDKEEKNLSGATYTVGKNPNGGMTLDASAFGVENICDAVKLFVREMK